VDLIDDHDDGVDVDVTALDGEALAEQRALVESFQLARQATIAANAQLKLRI
jgi:hypothetical protein